MKKRIASIETVLQFLKIKYKSKYIFFSLEICFKNLTVFDIAKKTIFFQNVSNII
jgi:hypothetical protein